MQVRALKSQAVGAQQMNVIAPGDAVQFGGQRGVNAAGDHQGRTALDAPHNVQSRCYFGGRHGNDGQIGLRVGQVGQGAAVMHVQKGQRAGKPLRHQDAVQHLRLSCLGGRVIRLTCQNGNGAR